MQENQNIGQKNKKIVCIIYLPVSFYGTKFVISETLTLTISIGMKKILLLLLLLPGAYLYSQNFTVSGTITDAETGEFLIGASVYETVSYTGTSTNSYGFYSMKVSTAPLIISFSYIGYKEQSIELKRATDTVINIALDPVVDIGEVTVTGNAARDRVMSTQMSRIEIPLAKVKSLPVLMGETDLIKTIQLLPGVQSGMEGTSGLYVRGGGPDQNLILLDGVPVYNVNHLFGFFSVFNSDAIQNVSLIKGGFPARYGGRLSSVLDIRMKEGNMNKFHGEGAVGIISSKLTLEGPLAKGKTSFLISGRRTYADLLSMPFQIAQNKRYDREDYKERTLGGYYFYDLNAKVNHKFSDKSRVYFSIYSGKDKFYIKNSQKGYLDQAKTNYVDDSFKNSINWGNLTSVLRWNYILDKDIFSNISLTVSDYSFEVLSEEKSLYEFDGNEEYWENSISYRSGIRDYGVRWDVDFNRISNHYIKLGMGNTYHVYRPGITVAFSQDENTTPVDTTFGNKNLYSNETYFYAEDDFSLGSRLKFNLGLHLSNFNTSGKNYSSVEPRLSLRYKLSDRSSLKASYTKMSQYIHLLTNNTIGLPTDLWVPATETVEPQRAWQVATGYSTLLSEGYELSVETYYKSMTGLIEYKEGASFFNIMTDWYDKIESGNGESYGLEIFFEKTMGKTTGWIGYTLSKSTRQFENISQGRVYPYKYDQRHDISIVVNHKINEKIDLGATWIFGSGTAISMAGNKYIPLTEIEEMLYPVYSMYYGKDYYSYVENNEIRNSSRMPPYHRLDIGINFRKEKKWGSRVFSTGAYNVYSRQNAFYLFLDSEWDYLTGESTTVIKQISLFPIIPYIRYSFSF
jgi:hypothetical protein